MRYSSGFEPATFEPLKINLIADARHLQKGKNMINNFCIPEFSVCNLKPLQCRAIICDVAIEETDHENCLGTIELQFLIVSPSLEEPAIYKKGFDKWSIDGGIEAAFHCLITDDDVNEFPNLIGTVFDAEIYYRTYNSSIYGELELKKVVALPVVEGAVEDDGYDY